jgi:hypothetical protein
MSGLDEGDPRKNMIVDRSVTIRTSSTAARCGFLVAVGVVVGKTGAIVWVSGNDINNAIFVNNIHQWIFQFPTSGDHSLRLVRCSFDDNITVRGAAVSDGKIAWVIP